MVRVMDLQPNAEQHLENPDVNLALFRHVTIHEASLPPREPPSFICGHSRFPGVEPFDPSLCVGDCMTYSVIRLDTLESRKVSQAQAFSGRDDAVEEWAGQRSEPIPQGMGYGLRAASVDWRLYQPYAH